MVYISTPPPLFHTKMRLRLTDNPPPHFPTRSVQVTTNTPPPLFHINDLNFSIVLPPLFHTSFPVRQIGYTTPTISYQIYRWARGVPRGQAQRYFTQRYPPPLFHTRAEELAYQNGRVSVSERENQISKNAGVDRLGRGINRNYRNQSGYLCHPMSSVV